MMRQIITLTLSLALMAFSTLALQVAAKERKPTLLVPLPQQIPAVKDNPATPEKIALGKQLFFDQRLSGDNTISCATCHSPEKAFGDGLPQAQGVDGKKLARNSQSLLNVGLYKSYFWDGRAKSLEEQALGPIQSPDEMNQNLEQLERELNLVPDYVKQFQHVFGTQVTRLGIAQALAAFQRTLITEPAPFDLYLNGDKDALSKSAQRGLDLFQGEAGCVRCHQGPLLSDGKFYRLGVSSEDAGLAGVTNKQEDRAKFRTPSLRNIAETGPYMHNGSMKSLDEVVTYYYRGVPSISPEGDELDIQPLFGQSFSEITDLVAFLKSLSGKSPQVTPPELP